jgi:VWFA-related protein
MPRLRPILACGLSVLAFAGLFLLLHSAASSAHAQTAAQQPATNEQATIRVEAPSVVVDAIVTDKKGRPVTGLTVEDFRLSEEGVPQKIVSFEPPKEEAAPAEAEEPAGESGVEPSLESAAREARNRRFITLVIDLGDLSPGGIKTARDALARYVRTVLPADDYVALYWIDSSLHLAQPFTRDKQQVIEAVEKFGRHGPAGHFTAAQRLQTQEEVQDLFSSIVGMQAAATHADLTGPCQQPANHWRCLHFGTLMQFLQTQNNFQARAVFVALRAIAEAYAGLPGRKNVVVLSEGFPHSPETQPEMAAVIDAANRSNVAFYFVDPAGLAMGNSAESAGIEQSYDQRAITLAMIGPNSQELTGLNKFDWARGIGWDLKGGAFNSIASATGGFAIRNQNDLLPGLRRIDRDSREFYTLVYQPINTTYDGSFRQIKVEVLKAGLHVRHRAGYWAIPPGQEALMTPAAAQLMAGITSGTLRPSFAPKVNAALLLAPDGSLSAPVHVSLPTDSVKFEKDPKGGKYHSGVTLVLVGRGKDRSIVGVHQSFLSLDLDKKQWEEFRKKDTLDIQARLALSKLEPLSVEALLQFSNGTVAVKEQPLMLRAAQGPGPRLTSILLSNRIEPAKGPADLEDPLRGPNYQLYLPPEPRFAATDKLTAIVGLLDIPLHPLTRRPNLRLTFQIKAAGVKVASLPAQEVHALRNSPKNDLIVLKQFDLQGLRPGKYTFEVVAEDRISQHTTSQAAEFEVE